MFFAFLIYEPRPFFPLSGGPLYSPGKMHILENEKDEDGDAVWVGTGTEDSTVEGVGHRHWTKQQGSGDRWEIGGGQSKVFHEGPMGEDFVSQSRDPGLRTFCVGLH